MRVYVHRDVEVQGWWKSIAPPQCFEHFVVVREGEATVLQFVALYRVGCLRGVYNVHSYILYNIYSRWRVHPTQLIATVAENSWSFYIIYFLFSSVPARSQTFTLSLDCQIKSTPLLKIVVHVLILSCSSSVSAEQWQYIEYHSTI